MPFIGFGEKAIYAKSPNRIAPNYRIYKCRLPQATWKCLLSTLQECGYHEDYYVAFALNEFQFSNVEAGMDEQLNGL